ncbi:MAG: peptide ABC transporter substrate-binding protein [Dehalococcoidia bacterium]|nr:peptide ABC transporter substrate-binding protein [Chloroflexi bacterium CFX7]MCK6565815.1 peptide ABC transporter substrate-binding protein [Dehalococcoidia bacterium]NUQ56507.1 peptide ABC transporter substrate-binding protein [Dehalococcoidia bacterium]RIL04246.1 MAG: hypothetical protein DCC78_01325 [bacterium]
MSRRPSGSRRKLLVAAALVIALGGAGAALVLGLYDEDSSLAPVDQSYVEGVAGTWKRINPLFASTNEVDQDLVQLVFAGLVRLGPTGEVLPDLAALPQVSEDGEAYTFRLRRGLRWHDGEPLTSADVAFTIAVLTSPDFKGEPSLADPWLGVEVETPDELTVVLKLRQAYAPFLARHATLGILPEHLLRNLSGPELLEAPFNAAPVGAGPYVLKSLDSAEAVLEPYAEYHLGKPQIARLRLRLYSDYPSALRALQQGEVAGVMFREGITDAQLADLNAIKNLDIEHPQRGAYILLYLNNDQAAFFQDERVRRAISLALDREQIVSRVYRGVATPSSSAVPPQTWAYAGQYDLVEPRLEEAKQLLQEVGWIPHATTGILVREGAEFRITIRTDNDPLRVAVANEVARQLQQIGIRATVASTTFSVLRRDFLQERKYDAAIAGWDQGPDPDPYFGWHSSQMGTAGLNLANFADVVADSLIARGRTDTDVEVRRDSYRQFQEVWQELSPSVVIAYPRYTYAYPSALKGPNPGVLFSASLRFVDIHRWKY